MWFAKARSTQAGMRRETHRMPNGCWDRGVQLGKNSSKSRHDFRLDPLKGG